MALRLLLVGLVIGLGVELPSGDEIASWASSGSAWVQARVDGLLGPEAVAEATPSPDAEFAAIVEEMAQSFVAAPRPDAGFAAIIDEMAQSFVAGPEPDAGFAAVVDDMARSFAADLARVEPRPAEPPASPTAVVFEPLDLADDLETGIAFALNRESQGVGVTPEPSAPVPARASESGVPGGSERLASAVRLTGQAAAAWMAVLRGSGAPVAVR